MPWFMTGIPEGDAVNHVNPLVCCGVLAASRQAQGIED